METETYRRATEYWRRLTPENVPSAAKIHSFLADYEANFNELLEQTAQMRPEITESLSAIKEEQAQAGIHLSRPALCVALLDASVREPLLEDALRFWHERPLFSMLYDLATGFGRPLDLISAAEKTNEGQSVDLVLKPDEIERYSLTPNRLQEYAEALRQDPSGFTLIDRDLQNMERDNFPQQNKVIAIQGAKYGGTFYKAVYPLSDI